MALEQKIARQAGNAVARYAMIQEGDRILVACSGGKDSFTMLDILRRFQIKAPVKFGILAVYLDPGFGADYSRLERHFRELGVDYIIKKTRIAQIIKEKMPAEKTGSYCFLCSRLRRGVLYRIAGENKCNKLALGHNLDDAIETLLLNMFFVSSVRLMRPIYAGSRGKVQVIRPLIEVPESLIIEYAHEKKYPIIKQVCPFREEDSKRKELKKLLSSMSRHSQFYPSVQKALERLKDLDSDKE